MTVTRPLTSAPPTVAVAQLRAGSVLDRYVIAGVIGRGGMGVVYRAYDPKLQREVAIKIIRSDFGDGADATRRRFLREAQTMARLRDPNVVQIFDVHDQPGRLFIVMELVAGASARKWRKCGDRTWREVLAVYVAAGRGLMAAHAAGVIHRDFKPGNVLVGDDGAVRVTDFGLSRLCGSDTVEDVPAASGGGAAGSSSTMSHSRITIDGVVMGTPPYMSPEQAVGGIADEMSDQYSFCVSLWEALYGARPFPDENLDSARLGGAPKAPHRNVPKHVYRALVQGLRPSTVERHPSMADLLGALERNETPRRIGWAAGVVTVASVVFAAGAQPVLEARAAASCADGQSQLDAVWNAERRGAVAAGVRGTGANFADETWARLEPSLDDYALAWRSAWGEGCAIETQTGASESGAAPPAAVAACLDEAAVQLMTEVAVLESPDVASVRGAVAGIDALPLPSECLDVQRAESLYPAEAGPEVLAVATQLRRSLAEARGFAAAGRTAQALELAGSVMTGAEAIDWNAGVAEAQFLVADLHEEQGDYAAAESELDAAFDRAMSGQRDELAARIARKVCWFEGIRRGKINAALAWCDFADGLMARVRRPSALGAGLVAHTRGQLYVDAERFDEAEAQLLSAIELRREALGEEHPWVAASMKELGVVRRYQGRPDESLRLQEEALAMYEAALGPRHPYTSELHVSMGNLASSEKQYVVARSHFLKALSVAEASLGSEHPNVGLILSSLGAVHFDLGHHDASLTAFRRAVAILESPSVGASVGLGITLRNLGQLYVAREDPDAARDAFVRSKAVFVDALGPDDVNVQGMQLRLDRLAAAGAGPSTPVE